MIITKTLNIKVGNRMVKRYNELGYNVKKNDIINLSVEHLSKYSHAKLLCSCDNCGSEKIIKYNNYYRYTKNKNKYTCKKCNLDKRKITCLEKYGFDNVSKSNDIKIKKEKTMIENGTVPGFKTQKYKDSIFEKYGVENISQSEDIKIRKEETCMKNYGVKHPSQNEEIYKRQQISSLKLNRYEDTNLFYRGTYEKDFIDYCLLNNIVIENFKGSIDYFYEDTNRKYFPDFYIKKENMVIEVKSTYTYECEKEQNEIKKEATINSGFKFKFIIDKKYNSLM